MKRILNSICLFIFMITITIPFFVFAEVESVDRGYKENIKSYEINLYINKDRSVDVKETITYDFGNNQKHGIYRFIPINYSGRLGSPYINIKNFNVNLKNGERVSFKNEPSTTDFITRIGDPNKLVSGQQTYVIEYKAKNAASLFEGEEEFDWNAIGTGWTVPIKNINVFINGDENVIIKSNFSCNYGYLGSEVECEDKKNNTNSYFLGAISGGQAVTIYSKFPVGTFTNLSSIEKIFWETRWYIIIPFIFVISYLIIWFKYGRDPQKSGAIVVEYTPPKGMTPMLAGVITKPTNPAINNLSAEIIQLAISGYIKINQIKNNGFLKWGNDYEIMEIKKADNKIYDYQNKILSAFFSGGNKVKLSELKKDTNFGFKIKDIPVKVRRLSKELGYFKFSPASALTIAFIITTGLIALSIFFFSYIQADVFSWLILVVSWFGITVLAFLMPKRTLLGLKTNEYLCGLKIFINYAEKDRIRFINAPKMTPSKFEELLPYAIIFGLEKEWAKQFEGIYKKPSWYNGNFSAGFTVGALSNDLSGFSSVTSSSVSASTGSSGAGGGGGGSW